MVFCHFVQGIHFSVYITKLFERSNVNILMLNNENDQYTDIERTIKYLSSIGIGSVWCFLHLQWPEHRWIFLIINWLGWIVFIFFAKFRWRHGCFVRLLWYHCYEFYYFYCEYLDLGLHFTVRKLFKWCHLSNFIQNKLFARSMISIKISFKQCLSLHWIDIVFLFVAVIIIYIFMKWFCDCYVYTPGNKNGEKELIFF